MQQTLVQSLVQEDLTCHVAQLMSPHSRAFEPQLLNSLTKTTEAHVPYNYTGVCACALRQEEPWQWEALAPQTESSPHSPQLEKAARSNEDPAQPKINKMYKRM